jgi:hypothetical protein
MSRPQQTQPVIPAGPPDRSDESRDDNASAFDSEDRSTTEQEAQARNSEKALERALGRLPPG